MFIFGSLVYSVVFVCPTCELLLWIFKKNKEYGFVNSLKNLGDDNIELNRTY